MTVNKSGRNIPAFSIDDSRPLADRIIDIADCGDPAAAYRNASGVDSSIYPRIRSLTGQ